MLLDLQQSLTPMRLHHVLGVVQTGLVLGKQNGFDLQKIYLAALLHDCAKGMNREALEQSYQKGEFHLEEEDLGFPAIWHGPAGAVLAQTRYAVDDEEVLEAIAHHTLGLAAPSRTLRVLMAADSTEPTRNYPGIEGLRKLLRTDFNAGLVEVLRNKVADLHARGRKPHSRIFQTLQYLEQE